MRQRMRLGGIVLALALSLQLGCAKQPANLPPDSAAIWRANEVVIAIGELQSVAIKLNGVQVCDPAPCHPLLSTRNTGIVVDAAADALLTIDAVPQGWLDERT